MDNPTGLPYRPSVAAGEWLVISGQIGLRDGALVEDFAGEVDQVLANLAAQLEAHGLGLEHVVKTTCFLVDLGQFAEFNDRYAATFPEPRPARSTVQVAGLPLGARVEVEAWAHRG
jgi:2-iminobutanoate/2-iminopropanoate deaminase